MGFAIGLLGGCQPGSSCQLLPVAFSIFRFPDSCILIFAKAPVPGQVNTRLIPALGEVAAAELAQCWLYEKIELVVSSSLCSVVLCVSPDATHSAFASIKHRYHVPLDVQTGEDLGERMFNALDSRLGRYNRVILIGTDCPDLDVSYLEKAIISLDSAECVLGPATDGGYVLIGARRIDQHCFKGIQWGGADVFKDTQTRMAVRGLSCAVLPTLKDIDRPEDL